MKAKITNTRKRKHWIGRLGEWLDRNWFNGILLYLAGQFMLQHNVSVGFGAVSSVKSEAQTLAASVMPVSQRAAAPKPETIFVPAANVSQIKKASAPESKPKPEAYQSGVSTAGFSIRNLSPLLSPNALRKRGIPEEVIEAKLQVCKNYVASYADIAVAEMKAYGIPASITLAQGLLESDAGESTLARQSNNHFGIKCRTKCLGCTCRNYSDDDVYDMFRVFDLVKDSFREHSILLSGARYKHLQNLELTDYKGWAKGLKQAGYATDPNYAEKLIKIVEALSLHTYDRKV